MEIINTHIPAVKILKPSIFRDDRGYFCESFREDKMIEFGLDYKYVQDNQSMSHKGAVRGLHFQIGEYAQAKLVRVTQGSVLDVAVDLRKGSPHFGQHVLVELNPNNAYQLFVPRGFAHGFLTLEDNTVFQYKCSNYYNKESENGLLWNDPDLAIDWGIENPIISEKDKVHPRLKDYNSPFNFQP